MKPWASPTQTRATKMPQTCWPELGVRATAAGQAEKARARVTPPPHFWASHPPGTCVTTNLPNDGGLRFSQL